MGPEPGWWSAGEHPAHARQTPAPPLAGAGARTAVRARLARLDPGRPGLLAVVAVGVVGALLAFVGYLRARPVAVPLAAAVPTAAGAVSPARPATPVPPRAPALVVDVAGRVRHPGVVRLPAGARVADAVRAAGGPLPGARLGLLNLARRLADGEQVVVGVAAVGAAGPQAPGVTGTAPVAGDAGGAAGPVVDVNAATVEQLVGLPRVGPVLAQRIVDYRTAHGPFASVDDLQRVPGIGPATLAELRALVTV